MSGSLPKKIRVSTGSATSLGLVEGRLAVASTTAYLMTYRDGKCTANCSFCPQARTSRGRTDMLSRVSWPVFDTTDVLHCLEEASSKGNIKRVCIQALNYPEVFTHLVALATALNRRSYIPLSVSCQPLNRENLRNLAEAGVERIGVPLDVATEALFDKIKGKSAGGPYTWIQQLALLAEAVCVFGEGRVSTHVIVGLGETEKDLIETIQRCMDMGVLPALFAFTPIPGTALEHMTQPVIRVYRRMQVASYVLVHDLARSDAMCFDEDGHLTGFGIEKQTLMAIIRSGKPFLTSGCPDCNRPYYNEKPSGPIYNYPKKLAASELLDVERQLGLN